MSSGAIRLMVVAGSTKPPTSDQPRAVAHQCPAREFVGFPPSLNAVWSKHDIYVTAGSGARIPISLVGITVSERHRSSPHVHHVIKYRIDQDHITRRAQPKPGDAVLGDVARRSGCGI